MWVKTSHWWPNQNVTKVAFASAVCDITPSRSALLWLRPRPCARYLATTIRSAHFIRLSQLIGQCWGVKPAVLTTVLGYWLGEYAVLRAQRLNNLIARIPVQI